MRFSFVWLVILMAFPTGWTRRSEIQIPAAQVPADQSNFVVTLTDACFLINAPDIIDSDGAAPSQADAGDIRFSSDSAGTTQLACDIVKWSTASNPVNSVVQVNVLVPSLSSSVLNKIYVWWNAGGSQVQPSPSEPFGQYASYPANHKAIYTFEESPTASTPQLKDRTSNAHHGATSNMESGDTQVGKIGNAYRFDGVDEIVTISGSNIVGGLSAGSWLFWINRQGTGTGIESAIRSQNASPQLDTARNAGHADFFLAAGGSNPDVADSAMPQSTWVHYAGTYDGATLRLYRNGSLVDSTGLTGAIASDSSLVLGAGLAGVNQFNGLLDELRIVGANLSQSWIQTYYNNSNGPGTFAIAQAPVDVGPPVVAIHALDDELRVRPRLIVRGAYAGEASVERRRRLDAGMNDEP